MPKQVDVEAHLAALAHPKAATVEALRSLIRSAVPEAGERIKWNAPSYFLPGGDDRLTFRLSPPPILQLILHRGAKVKDPTGVPFDDPTGLVRWVAADRGVIEIADLAEVGAREADLADLLARWLRSAE